MFIQTFTDPQGTLQTDAVFEISDACSDKYNHESINFVISQGDSENSIQTATSGNTNINYQMFYWVSEQSRLDGKLPYILANTEPLGDRFYIESDLLNTEEYSGLSLTEIVEKHCSETLNT